MNGHLVGSIGEVLACYHYGIRLFEASTPIHDGEAHDGKSVQIKMTQGNTIVISEQPDYLIVLFMNRKTGKVQEIYNGPGEIPYMKSYVYRKAQEIFKTNYTWENDVRSMTVRAVNLIPKNTPQQLDLLTDYKKLEKMEKIEQTVEKIRGIYGKRSLHVATLLQDLKISRDNSPETLMPSAMYRS